MLSWYPVNVPVLKSSQQSASNPGGPQGSTDVGYRTLALGEKLWNKNGKTKPNASSTLLERPRQSQLLSISWEDEMKCPPS